MGSVCCAVPATGISAGLQGDHGMMRFDGMHDHQQNLLVFSKGAQARCSHAACVPARADMRAPHEKSDTTKTAEARWEGWMKEIE